MNDLRYSALFLARSLDDLDEGAGVEAGAADKGAIDVRLVHELVRVFWLHAPAILNPDSFGCRIIGHFMQSVTNERMGFLRLSGGGVAASANGPDRLVCNHS